MTSENTALLEARSLVGRFGRRARQIVVDELVVAIKKGDETAVADRNAVLRELIALADQDGVERPRGG